MTKGTVEDAIWQLRRSKCKDDDITAKSCITRRDVYELLRTLLVKAQNET